MKRRHSGFTLIELMVSLLVLSVLLAIAVPTFRTYTRNSRVTAAQNDLVTAFSYARSEATLRSQSVVVCASQDRKTCSGDTNWATGWIVQIQSGKLLQTWDAPGGDVTATGTADQLVYQPTGTVEAGATFAIAWSGCTGHHQREISVLLAGSPEAQTKDCT